MLAEALEGVFSEKMVNFCIFFIYLVGFISVEHSLVFESHSKLTF